MGRERAHAARQGTAGESEAAQGYLEIF